MTGPKLTAMILFGTLSFLFGIMFTIGLISAFGAIVTGAITAGLTCAFIWFAQIGRHAFARGFLALGAVFIVVPVAALLGFGEQVANSSLTAIQTGEAISEEEASQMFVSTLLASAGLVFGIFVGMILVLIGGLMHRAPRPTATP